MIQKAYYYTIVQYKSVVGHLSHYLLYKTKDAISTVSRLLSC